MDTMKVSKTIMTVFPLIPQFINAVQTEITDDAYHSYYGETNTLQIMERIIRKTVICETLDNLRVKLTKELQEMPYGYGDALKFFFCINLSSREIAKKMGITRQTAYRKIHQGIAHLSRHLAKIGITDSRFRCLYDDCGFIRRIYNRVDAGDKSVGGIT